MFRWRFRKDRKLFAMSDVARDVARGLDKTLLNLRDSEMLLKHIRKNCKCECRLFTS